MKKICVLLMMVITINSSTVVFAVEKDKNVDIIQIEDTDVEIEYDDDFLYIQNLALDSMAWNIKNNVEKRTKGFRIAKGNYLRLKMEISSVDNVEVGIVDESGRKTNIKAKSLINTSIYINRTGMYYIFVKNKSGKTINIKGYYGY